MLSAVIKNVVLSLPAGISMIQFLPPDSYRGKKMLKDVGLGRALSAVVAVTGPVLTVSQHTES